jgi:hypothetical protein
MRPLAQAAGLMGETEYRSQNSEVRMQVRASGGPYGVLTAG